MGLTLHIDGPSKNNFKGNWCGRVNVKNGDHVSVAYVSEGKLKREAAASMEKNIAHAMENYDIVEIDDRR